MKLPIYKAYMRNLCQRIFFLTFMTLDYLESLLIVVLYQHSIYSSVKNEKKKKKKYIYIYIYIYNKDTHTHTFNFV